MLPTNQNESSSKWNSASYLRVKENNRNNKHMATVGTVLPHVPGHACYYDW